MANYGDTPSSPSGDPYGGPSGANPYGTPAGNNPYGSTPPGGSPYGMPPADPLSQPLRGATFAAAYVRYWKKYVVFAGRASRSEFWWVFLINFIISAALNGPREGFLSDVGYAYSIATIVPSLALGARRLHDIGRSGWWQLIAIIPIIGWIILIVWFATGPKQEGLRYDQAKLA